ncbi:MAG: 6,7-dimethyl-8-ribityllumazine synthase [Candidatus Hydrogenedentota bacterium]
MAKEITGKLDGKGTKIGIVVSRFNEFITSKLLSGCLDGLQRLGVADKDILVCWVPGSFEISAVCKKLVDRKDIDGVIALGAVIRGATPHFEYIASEVTKGIAQLGLQGAKPVIYGVLTSDTIEQAIERAGTKAGNKGFEAALSCVEMINIYKQL